MNTKKHNYNLKKGLMFSGIIILIFYVVFDYISSYLAYPESIPTSLPSEHYFEFDPIQMWKLKTGYHDENINITKSGFRSEKEISSDGYKKYIFLIGGSASFGLGVKDNQTVSYFLQQLLLANPKTKYYEFINAGVTGYYSTQELIHVFRNLLNYNPIMIVALTGRNEIFYSLHPGYMPDKIPYHGLIRKSVGALDNYYTSSKFKSSKIHFLRLLQNILSPLSYSWSKEWDEGVPELISGHDSAIYIFIKNQKSLYAMLTGLGVEYHLFLQPTVNYPDRKLTEEDLAFTKVNYLNSLNSGYKKLKNIVDRELNKSMYHGIIDFSPLSGNYFIDDAHFSEEGARYAARIIYENIWGKTNISNISLEKDHNSVLLLTGWHHQEEGFRWTNGDASLKLSVPDCVKTAPFHLQGINGHIDSDLSIYLDNKKIISSRLLPNQQINISVDTHGLFCNKDVIISIKSTPWIPKNLGLTEDTRQLGIAVKNIGF